MSEQWRKRAAVGVWTAVLVVMTSVVVVLAKGDDQPDLAFAQAGHWVHNAEGKAVYHVDGGTKQVDARTGEAAIDGDHAIVQGDGTILVATGDGVTVFAKSTLAVDGRVPVGIKETPTGLEVVGGPYFVYRGAGTIVRFDMVPPTVIEVGGPLSDPAVTTDGTVWVQRTDSAALCHIERGSRTAVCPATAPGGRKGSVAASDDHALFIDAAAGTATPIGPDGLGATAAIRAKIPDQAQPSTTAVAGRLPMIDPSARTLVLADVSAVGRGGEARDPVTVSLGDGDFAAPVVAGESIVVLERSKGRLLTFTAAGKPVSTVAIPHGADRVKVSRGQDGRVYVDEPGGKHTMVVDGDGSVHSVGIGKKDLPAPKSETPPPTTPPAPPPLPQQPAPQPGQPKASPPGAPTSVGARPGNAAVTLSWGAASPNGARVTGYEITWRVTDGSGPGGASTVPGNSLSTEITGLRNGSTYVFSVAARNAAGVGPTADSPSARPSSDVPGAPGRVTAVADATGSVRVSWEPADAEGRRITSYAVTATGQDGSTVPAGTAPSTMWTTANGALQLGTGYTFTVVATNDLGLSGGASAPSNSVHPYRPADAPTAPQATGTDRTVTLRWGEPALNGGELVSYAVSANGVPTQTVTQPTATFTGLTNGTRYTFSVSAQTRQQNQSGPPVAGAAAQVMGTPGRTATVDAVSARLSGDRQISVALSVNDFGSGAVTCRVTFNGAERWAGGCAGTMEITVGNLAYATTYDIAASGSNSFGTGPPGGHASARTNDPPPPPPALSVSKGPKRTVAGCTDVNNCALIHVTARNFPANTTFRVSCQTDYPGPAGEFYAYNARTDGAGAFDSEVCVYGYPGRQVWAVVNGVASGRLTW